MKNITKAWIDFYYAWSALIYNAILIVLGVLLSSNGNDDGMVRTIFITGIFCIFPLVDFISNKRIQEKSYILMFIATTGYFIGLLAHLINIFVFSTTSPDYLYRDIYFIAMSLALICNILSFFFIKGVKNRGKYKLLAISYFVFISIDYYLYIWHHRF